jgi:hypothetical protein
MVSVSMFSIVTPRHVGSIGVRICYPFYKVAKDRGISRTKLVRFVMEKVVKEELVHSILDSNDLSNVEPPPQKYRRLRNRG